jgi:D-glucosaminate-6-phosphate ammonia-lyase
MEQRVSDQVEGAWQAFGLPSIINAAGKMTYLGGSAVSAEVAAAMSSGARSYVEMAELKSAAGLRAAELIGVPAACIVSSAAAGICQSVAATITGVDRALVEQVPFVDTARRNVIIQKSHAVNFGASITQMIRLGGGNVIEIGTANRSYPYHLESALSDTTAAVVFVISHHTHPEAVISLAETIALAHRRGVKVIVDAAAETDLRKYVESGADLVVYSGHKAISGPTSGIVGGDPALVAACAIQESGAGRAMKVSKEAISGLLCALERYVSGKTAPPAEVLLARLEAVRETSGDDLPVGFSTVWDGTRPIPRLVVGVPEGAQITAGELVARLESANPSIRTRNHDVAAGAISIDPRELTLEDARALGLALRQVFSEKERARSK